MNKVLSKMSLQHYLQHCPDLKLHIQGNFDKVDLSQFKLMQLKPNPFVMLV